MKDLSRLWLHGPGPLISPIEPLTSDWISLCLIQPQQYIGQDPEHQHLQFYNALAVAEPIDHFDCKYLPGQLPFHLVKRWLAQR